MFHILIVEDDKDLNKTVCKYLSQQGYEAVGCLNAEIPVLFMTARDDFTSKQKGYRIGIDDYMVIVAVILGVLSVSCFIVSIAQFKKKGILFNNEYLYASEQKRKTMDKEPYYKQSGIVFLLLGVFSLMIAAYVLFHAKWLIYCGVATIISTMLYAIVSSVQIDKSK